MIDRPGESAARESGGWGRPDASMSLLADLSAGRLLDPGYAEAAARRAASGDSAGRWPGGVVLVLVLAGVLIAVAGAEVRRSEPVAQRQRSRLIEQIHTRTAESDALQRRLAALRDETERLRAMALARSEIGRRARADLARAGASVAATPVSGHALVVTLDDAGNTGNGGSPAGRVYDQDLQELVNGLWAAGATAIGVNGQRLTPLTAIRTAGEAILVDYRPLSPPYVVTALGDRRRLHTVFDSLPAAGRLRELESRFGIRYDVRQVSSARLPAAGVLNLRYAREETHG